MSDDSFIREVNEEIRQDQARALWDRYGPLAIGARRARRARDRRLRRLRLLDRDRAPTARATRSPRRSTLANAGKNDEALGALAALEADGYGAYPLLARMRAATVLADKGDFAGAVAGFDAVAADTSIPDGHPRHGATARRAACSSTTAPMPTSSARVEALTSDTNPLRHSAREALGLSAWKEGRAADALKLFDQIAADEAAPRNARERATLMAELIRGSGTAS